MNVIYTDVLIIGAGLAGLRMAIGAKRRGHDAIILSLVPAKRSHSKAAQGGMQASLGNVVKGQGDNEDIHFEDTVRGSDWGADQDVVRMFVNTAPKAIRELAAWGVPWSRVQRGDRTVVINGQKVVITERDEAHGTVAQRDFGGTKKWRTCYVSDGTGHAMINTVADRAIAESIPVHERTEALALIHDGSRCYGAVVRDLVTGRLTAYVARATGIAAGGAGRLFRVTTNAVICEGIGHALALETGVSALGNMEAVQFHPTGIFPAGILVTEGCRGDGGLLKDADGHRFMPDYEPEKKELASRDVVSRRMEEHIAKGKGVKSRFGEHLWLDITLLGEHHIKHNLREVYEICHYFLGVDPVKDPIPVRPGTALHDGRRAHPGLRRKPDAEGAVRGRRGGLLGHARLQPPGRQLRGRDRRRRHDRRRVDRRLLRRPVERRGRADGAGAGVPRPRARQAFGPAARQRDRGRDGAARAHAADHDRQGRHLPPRQRPRGGGGRTAAAHRAQPQHRRAHALGRRESRAGQRLPHAHDAQAGRDRRLRCTRPAPKAAAPTTARTTHGATTRSGSSARWPPGRTTTRRCRRWPTSRST